MPKYLVDGILTLKYKVKTIANSDIEAKKNIEENILDYIKDHMKYDSFKIITNEISPTVEIIQD
jgi:hypothetical protein